MRINQRKVFNFVSESEISSRIRSKFSNEIVVSDLIGLSRINFSSDFLDWFELIRIGSNTNIGIIWNSSDWLGMNSYPKFSPGYYLNLNTIYSFFQKIVQNKNKYQT